MSRHEIIPKDGLSFKIIQLAPCCVMVDGKDVDGSLGVAIMDDSTVLQIHPIKDLAAFILFVGTLAEAGCAHFNKDAIHLALTSIADTICKPDLDKVLN